MSENTMEEEASPKVRWCDCPPTLHLPIHYTRQDGITSAQDQTELSAIYFSSFTSLKDLEDLYIQIKRTRCNIKFWWKKNFVYSGRLELWSWWKALNALYCYVLDKGWGRRYLLCYLSVMFEMRKENLEWQGHLKITSSPYKDTLLRENLGFQSSL